MPDGENAFVTDAAFCTRIALVMDDVLRAVCALVTLFADIVLVLLLSCGIVSELRTIISTSILQLLFAAIVPPVKPRLRPRLTAVNVPPQVFRTLGTDANCMDVGKVSVNATLVSAKALLLFNWMTNREAGPLPCKLAAANVLLPVIAFTLLTDNVALAAVDGPPMLLLTLAGGMVLR
jgi:hypothetical protein